MALTVPTLQDFADFLTVDVSSLGPADTQALKQAGFLLQVLGGCSDSPTEDPCKSLFDNAIMDMANWMRASLPFVSAVASPFQSETIGSYSYSKAFRNVLLSGMSGNRVDTGVMWFDLAVRNCACGEESSAVAYGSTHVFEDDGVYISDAGQRWILGPAEANVGFEYAGFVLADVNREA